MKKLLKDIKGTALLVSLLVMGVLVSIALSLSALIFRELMITKDFLNSGIAYYVAESGTEIALYALEYNLAGWEPINLADDGSVEYLVNELKGSYILDNRCKAYPCFDGYEGTNDLSQYYAVLDQNESIHIPLFVVEGGVEIPVGDFVVEFYATFDPGEDLNFEADDLDGWDILRWKIYGINETYGITESISDFTAFSLIEVPGTEEDRISTNSTFPSWFGTKSCSDSGGFSNRYTDEIKCGEVSFGGVENLNSTATIGENVVAETYLGLCTNTQAREYYEYEGSSIENRELSIIKHCPEISEFNTNHKLNYLILTNLINTSVFKDTVDADQEEAFSKIYFRVEVDNGGDSSKTNELVRSVADIKASGESEGIKQSINVKIRRGSFMPVFNFSLYSTYKEDACEGWGEDC